MCGRYINQAETKEIIDTYKINIDQNNPLPLFAPQDQITPGSVVPVITGNSPNKLDYMKWGLVPYWAKDPKIGYKMFNARAETLSDKPSFKEPFKKRRCLVPATGFYEWKKDTDSKMNIKKTPYLFTIKNRRLFSFAGLYDIWLDAEGKELKTFTIITTEANALMKPIHDRMPVIVDPQYEDLWLNIGSDIYVVKDFLGRVRIESLVCNKH